MIAKLALVFRERLAPPLPWIERFGGLTTVAERGIYGKLDTGEQVLIGTETWPVACDTENENCWSGAHEFFMPDLNVGAVAFFVDNGGLRFSAVEGPQSGYIRYRFSIRLLVWLNGRRLGKTDCDFADCVAAWMMGRLIGSHQISTISADPNDALIYHKIQVLSVSMSIKGRDNFAAYTFARQATDRGLFMYPYDNFALTIEGEVLSNIKCLENCFEGIELQNVC